MALTVFFCILVTLKLNKTKTMLFILSKKHMKNRIYPALALLIGLLFFTSAYLSNDPKPLKIGKTAPLQSEKMRNVDGTELSLSDSKQEKGLLVVFSCNTCPFVVGNEHFAGWEKQYNTIHTLAKESKIGMVLVNSNEGKRDKDDAFDAMVDHSKTLGYTMPYLLDRNSKLADAFGAKTTPHVYLFNADMKLVYSGSIDNTWDSKRTEDIHYLSDALSQLSTDAKITLQETPPRGCGIKRVKI
jgi:thioredoxin-related protein